MGRVSPERECRMKIRKWWFLWILLMVFAIGAPSVQAAKIQLSPKKVILIKGQKKVLKLSGAKGKVSWKSSNKAVAAVKSGKVTAKKAGSAVITARVSGKSFSCRVMVEDPVLSKTKAEVKVGNTIKLKLSGTKQKVTWTSSKKTVATVSSKGKVVGKKTGTAKITATVLNKKFTCKVTVVKAENSEEETKKEEESRKAEESSETKESQQGESRAEESQPAESKPEESQPAESDVPKESEPEETKGTEESKPSDEADDFDFERDVTVIRNGGSITSFYFELNDGDNSLVRSNLQQAGFSLNGKTASREAEAESVTYIFRKLPETLEGLKRIPLVDEFSPMAAVIAAIASFDLTKATVSYAQTHPFFEMMDYLNGPESVIGNARRSDLFDAIRTTLKYARFAYFVGASTANAYKAEEPFTFTLVKSPVAVPAKESSGTYQEGIPARQMILISVGWQQKQRYMTTYKSSADGKWYGWDASWQDMVAQIPIP